MMQKYAKLWIFCFSIPLLLDRLTKYLVVSGSWANTDITSFLEIYLTYNRGVSWGLGSSDNRITFVVVSTMVAAVMLYFIWYLYHVRLSMWSYATGLIILSGAVSNFFDRLWFGGVVDFIRFHYAGWSFPVFNVADIFISVGTCFLLLLHWFFEEP